MLYILFYDTHAHIRSCGVCKSGRRICIQPRNYYATSLERQIAEGKSLSVYTRDACVHLVHLNL